MKKVETLAEYVKRVMKEKQLSALNIEARSNRKITDGYIAKIRKGQANNPTVEKLQALAVGLGVDEDEVFQVARGLSPGEKRGGEAWPSYLVLRMMLKAVSNPDILRVLQYLVKMKPTKIKAILKSIESEK